MARPTSKADKFLRDLKALCEKYNMEIGGCGCCGSPFVRDKKSKEYVAEDVNMELEKGVLRFVADGKERRI